MSNVDETKRLMNNRLFPAHRFSGHSEGVVEHYIDLAHKANAPKATPRALDTNLRAAFDAVWSHRRCSKALPLAFATLSIDQLFVRPELPSAHGYGRQCSFSNIDDTSFPRRPRVHANLLHSTLSPNVRLYRVHQLARRSVLLLYIRILRS